MATLLTSAISEILQKDIAPEIQSQLNEETILLNKLPKNKRGGFANNVMYQDVQYGRNESIAAISSSSTTLPTSGYQRRAQAQVSPAYIYGTINIDDRTIEQAKGNPGSIVNILTEETQGLKRDFAKDMNRQLFGKGDGVIAKVAASSTSTTITVDTTKYITDGQLLTINGDEVQVVSVVSDTTFYVTTAVTVATNETALKTNGSSEMNGLFLAADDGTFTTTFEGISTSTSNYWKAFVDATTETYTTLAGFESDIRAAVTAVEKYGKPEIIVSDHSLRDGYMNLSAANQRFVNTRKLDGNFDMEAIMFGGIPWVADFDCQNGTMYVLDFSALSLEYLTPLKFRERGQNGVLEPVTGTTYYEIVMNCYANLMCNNRRKLAKLTAKAVTA